MNEHAFPFDDSADKTVNPGMTLRDYFAAKALQGLLSDLPKGLYGFDWVMNTAKESYSLADAMLKAREQK